MKPFPCTKCGLCCKVLPKFIMHLIDENIKAGGTTAQKMFKAQAEFCNKLINLHVPENDREKYYVKL